MVLGNTHLLVDTTRRSPIKWPTRSYSTLHFLQWFGIAASRTAEQARMLFSSPLSVPGMKYLGALPHGRPHGNWCTYMSTMEGLSVGGTVTESSDAWLA